MELLKHVRWSLALLVAAALGLAVTTAGAQQQNDTPSDAGTSPEEPIEAPDDSENKAGAISSDDDEDWKYRYIHNDTGRDDDPETEEVDESHPGKSADWVRLEVKEPSVVTSETGGQQPKPLKIVEYRIVIDEVKKKVNGLWVDVLKEMDPEDGKGDKIVIELSQALAYCETLRIRMRVERRVVERESSTKPWKYGDWNGDTNDEKVNFNATELLDGDQNKIEKAVAGIDPIGNGNGNPGQQGSMDVVFAGLDPVFQPAHAEAGVSEQYGAPDLLFGEGASWAMPSGEIRFYATGGAWFADNAPSLSVIARDADGNDAEAAGEIALGIPSVVNGVIEVPVAYRDAEAALRVAVMVRGAEVVVPALTGGTILNYAVGGSSTGGGPVRTPPLVRVGAAPDADKFVAKTHASIEILYEDPQDPGPLTAQVGRYIHMARPYQSGSYGGYIDAIVLGESEAGVFRAGSFEIDPVDDFSFIETEDTKLFVVNADDHSEVEDAFDNAEITVTSKGGLRVELGQRAASATPLKLIILNPKLDLGQAPFTPGDNARVAIAGDALRAGPHRTFTIVERHFGHQNDYELLPDSALTATALTPLAEVETD